MTRCSVRRREVRGGDGRQAAAAGRGRDHGEASHRCRQAHFRSRVGEYPVSVICHFRLRHPQLLVTESNLLIGYVVRS